MEKPKPKKEVAVGTISEKERVVFFNASRDAAGDFAEFGFITEFETCYLLFVDRRFDFNEVVTYMENYD